MKRIVIVFLFALLISLVVLYLIKPEIVEKIWLWIVGLLGAIIAFLTQSAKWANEKFSGLVKKIPSNSSEGKSTGNEVFMQILRYSRLGNKIYGLIYIEGKFSGISNENAENLPGSYKLGIKGNNIIFSNPEFVSSIVTSGQAGFKEGDITLVSDKNGAGINDELAFNHLFEKLSTWLELERQPLLQILDLKESNDFDNSYH
jgi:hypothetical protein